MPTRLPARSLIATALIVAMAWLPAGASAAGLPDSGFVPVAGAAGVQGDAAAVSAAAPNAVWLVGSRTRGGVQRPLVERWTGSAWRLDALPAGLHGFLSAVVAISRTNVWAVGTVLHDGARRGLVLRYDGHDWRRARAPAYSDGLQAITGFPDGRVYVTGLAKTSEIDCGAEAQRLLKWTGSAWRRLTTFDDGCSEDGSGMGEITALPHGPLLVSTYDFSHETGGAPGLLCFKQGCPSGWPPFPTFDDVGDTDGDLPTITAAARDDVWMAGNPVRYPGPEAVLDHWDGSAWTMLTSPASDTVDIAGVAETGPDDVWLAGSFGWAYYEVLTPLIYHATGGVLTQLASPAPSGSLAAITHVPGTGSEMWAVGSANGRPLILHHP